MLKLLVASGNPGKLVEIQDVLNDLPGEPQFELILPAQLGLALEVVEDGETYAANAALKARAYAFASGLHCMADDSGLEVAALDGAPGLHSARFHPRPGASDADRRAYLLRALDDKPQPWMALFHCTIAIANPQGKLWYVEGQCQGQIIPQERGSNGFGYDPIFYLPELGRTMAEIDRKMKNQLSHRSRAVRAALPLLYSLAAEGAA